MARVCVNVWWGVQARCGAPCYKLDQEARQFMTHELQVLAELGILHNVIPIFAGALVVMLFVYMIVSWIPQWRDGKFGRFMSDLVSPIIGPLDRIIPPISLGGLRFSIGFFVGWWAIGIVAALIIQSLPSGW